MAMWDGRFSAETNKELAKFSESVHYDKRLYAFDIMGSKAHVKMLAKQGIIPERTAWLITEELDNIKRRIDAGDFEFKSELEDIHMNIESALIGKLGAEGARLHSGRSRNDQIALDIRLYLRHEIQEIQDLIVALQKALLSQAEAHRETILPGFTHTQHAQVVLFAHHMLAYMEMFERDCGRLTDCSNRMNVMPLGSGALAGSTLHLDRRMVCEELGFSAVTRNSMDAVSDRDFIIELLGALSIFAMHISRLSEDFVWWSSQEFQFIEFADEFCTGSSLMPQKKNPDVAELARGKTGRIYGALMALLTVCKGLPLTYNRDLQEDKEELFDAIDTVKMILRVYPPMIATMTVKADNMRAAACDPALMATDLAEQLVKQGVPFRTAHHQVGALVKLALDARKPLDGLTLDEMKQAIPTATADFLDMFKPESSVAKREITGGTGYNAVASQIEFWRGKLS
ncbi:MAG: argininosuccinate lyase [Victivallaceae bacterium]|nr:argininosuccinate lyase [Victivallaceae bacterium]